MNIPISNDTEAHKQTQEELEEEYENAKSWLDELESARRSKKIDVEVARAKIRVLKLKIIMVNLEREKELASRLRMCSIPSKVHSYGRFPEMKPRECYCVHVWYSIIMEQMHCQIITIINIKDVDARYDHRIEKLQDEIDELESQQQLEWHELIGV